MFENALVKSFKAETINDLVLHAIKDEQKLKEFMIVGNELSNPDNLMCIGLNCLMSDVSNSTANTMVPTASSTLKDLYLSFSQTKSEACRQFHQFITH